MHSQSEGFRQVIDGLKSPMIETQLDAVWCCINITAATNSRYTNRLIELGALKELKRLISSAHKKLSANAVWVCSNLAGNLWCFYHHYIILRYMYM